jgi:hypothetical protein
MTFTHRLSTAGLLMLCLSACGSKDAWKAAPQPARGTLTINGQPEKGVYVTLHPVDGQIDVRQTQPWGVTDDAGNFSVRTYEKGDGAPIGEYQVTFIWRIDPRDPQIKDRLGFAYAKPEHSKWTVQIGEGENTLPPIAVAGAKVNRAGLEPKQ